MSKETRVRLGTVDLLPREADEDVARAAIALRERRSTREAIRRELCRSLREKGLKPISKGAFSRWASRVHFSQEDGSRDPIERAPYPVALSDQTRRLLAQALRSLADDLVRDVPDRSAEVRAMLNSFLGLPQ